MRQIRIIVIALLHLVLVGCSTQGHSTMKDFPIPTDPNAIVDISKVTVAPKPLTMVRRDNRIQLGPKGTTGSALVYFVVRKDGTVTDIEISPAIDPRLGASAKVSVEQLKFSPATIRGVPVNCRMSLPMDFFFMTG